VVGELATTWLTLFKYQVCWVNDIKLRAHVSVCWKEKGVGRRIEGESGAMNGVYEGRRTVGGGGGPTSHHWTQTLTLSRTAP
jgi:hypothetical protein